MEELTIQFQSEHFRDPAGQSLGHPLEAKIVRVGTVNQTVPAGWTDQIGALLRFQYSGLRPQSAARATCRINSRILSSRASADQDSLAE